MNFLEILMMVLRKNTSVNTTVELPLEMGTKKFKAIGSEVASVFERWIFGLYKLRMTTNVLLFFFPELIM